MERKGASYKITQTRAAQSHAEHTQRTNATTASEMYDSPRGMGPAATASAKPYNNLVAAMDIRGREYDDARAGRMSAEQMNRVGIDSSKYPVRPAGVTGAGMRHHPRPPGL